MSTTTSMVPRVVTDAIVDKLTGISTQYYLETGNVRDLNVMRIRAQLQWDALLAVAQGQPIDPRWAGIDFDKVNAELRDYRDQITLLRSYIDQMQPVQANAQGYVDGSTPIPDAALVHQVAQSLINLADQAGQVVTIERTPRKPLAMGHADYLVSVRPARGKS